MTQSIDFKSSERMTIIGQSGSGKSVLSRFVFDNTPARNKMVINPKGSASLMQAYPDYQRNASGRLQGGLLHVIRRVDRKDYHGWDKELQAGFYTGNTLFLFDELPMMANESRYSQAMQDVYQAGRERKVGAIACAQRPVGIPNFCISEVEHLCVFFTQLGSDRDKLEKATQADWSILLQLPKHYFAYWTQGMTQAVIVEPV